MKFPSNCEILNNRRGEIATIFILIGMAVVGLGIAAGSYLQNPNNRINLFPKAASSMDTIWEGVKSSKSINPSGAEIYPWSNAGPTTGWESYWPNNEGRVYICNGVYCWTLQRANGKTELLYDGKPFNIQTEYSTLRASSTGRLPWSGNGPTAAWTWQVPYNGQTVNETMLCNGSFCWRHIKYPNPDNTHVDGWRDDGLPIDLATRDIWKDHQELYTNTGPSVGWADPVTKKATLCNGTVCMVMDYGNGWKWLPSDVT